jgi:hypothetical protein
MADVKLFDGPVDIVSVGPGEKVAGALSFATKTLCWFVVPTPRHLWGKKTKMIVPQSDQNELPSPASPYFPPIGSEITADEPHDQLTLVFDSAFPSRDRDHWHDNCE